MNHQTGQILILRKLKVDDALAAEYIVGKAIANMFLFDGAFGEGIWKKITHWRCSDSKVCCSMAFVLNDLDS